MTDEATKLLRRLRFHGRENDSLDALLADKKTPLEVRESIEAMQQTCMDAATYLTTVQAEAQAVPPRSDADDARRYRALRTAHITAFGRRWPECDAELLDATIDAAIKCGAALQQREESQ